MKQIVGSEPAYPHESFYGGVSLGMTKGMTIRQAFVMAAMHGIVADPECSFVAENIAATSISIADETLQLESMGNKTEQSNKIRALEILQDVLDGVNSYSTQSVERNWVNSLIGGLKQKMIKELKDD